MRNRILVPAALAIVFVALPSAVAGAAADDGYMFEISDDGTYAQTMVRQTDGSSMEATVTVLLDGTWSVEGSVTDADIDDYTFAVGIAGQCTPSNVELFNFTVAADPGVTHFSWTGAPTLAAGYDFIRIYRAGDACQTNWSSYIPSQPYGMITAPEADSIHAGSVTLGATYYDDDFDEAQWAVRPYSANCTGTNVAGGGPGVSGVDDPYDWNGRYFSATLDTTDWDPGHYCFVFNTEQSGEAEADVRLIRSFYVADAHVTAGGQLIEGPGNDPTAKISLGGWLFALAPATPPASITTASDLVCEWNIVFHNVSNDALDKAQFWADTCTELNTFVPTVADTDGVVNLTATGTLNGEPGYEVILRLEDRTEPATMDTIRIELFDGTDKIYDTDGGDFTPESDNVGTARTGLDRGNIQISYY